MSSPLLSASRRRAALLAALAPALAATAACASGGQRAPTAIRAAAADTAAARALARERELDPATIPPRTVTVVPLAVQASDTNLLALGYGLADFLSTDLARSKQLRVVDRLRLDAMLRELRTADAGAPDSALAARAGKLVGARRVVTGSLTQTSWIDLRLDMRVADVQSGVLPGGLAATAPVDRIIDAEKQLAFRVFEMLGVTLTVAERAAIEQRPTGDLSALLAYSRGVRAEARRDFAAAAAEYSAAVRYDPAFAAARANLGAVQRRPSEERSQMRRITAAATGAVNAPAASTAGSAADAAFQAAQQMVTLLVDVRIP